MCMIMPLCARRHRIYAYFTVIIIDHLQRLDASRYTVTVVLCMVFDCLCWNNGYTVADIKYYAAFVVLSTMINFTLYTHKGSGKVNLC